MPDKRRQTHPITEYAGRVRPNADRSEAGRATLPAVSTVAVTRWVGAGPPDEADLAGRLRASGLSGTGWGNGPGDRYGWHRHEYDKILYCVRGSIVFHTDHGDLALEAGDRLDLTAGTPHAATVGPDGVRCLEAAVAISSTGPPD